MHPPTHLPTQTHPHVHVHTHTHPHAPTNTHTHTCTAAVFVDNVLLGDFVERIFLLLELIVQLL